MSLSTILICAVLALIIAFIATAPLRSALRSVSFQDNASAYKKEGSLNITGSSEKYLYNRISKTEKPRQK